MTIPDEATVVTAENCSEVIDRKLWEAIDLLGEFPDAVVPPKTWQHLFVYARDAQAPRIKIQ